MSIIQMTSTSAYAILSFRVRSVQLPRPAARPRVRVHALSSKDSQIVGVALSELIERAEILSKSAKPPFFGIFGQISKSLNVQGAKFWSKGPSFICNEVNVQ